MGSDKAALSLQLSTSLADAINWYGSDNHLLLNPRWPLAELASLKEVAQSVSQQFGLRGHVWLSTSGTTSLAVSANKLVALSKEAFLSSAQAVNEHLRANETDVWLQALPRFHVGGLGVEVRAMLSKSRVVTDLERWDPERITALIANQNITLVSFVPAQVFDLVSRQVSAPSSLRAVIVGGGALSESLYQSARRLGWPLLPSYGMTETCSQIATAKLEPLAASGASSGKPRPTKLSHVQWRKSLDGFLEVRGSSLLTCYGQRHADHSIRGWDPKVDGWFQSEDLVELFGNEIEFSGRRNDFIKIGGESTSISNLRAVLEKVLSGKEAGLSQQIVLVDAPSERLGSEIHLVHTGILQEQLITEIKETYNGQVLPFEKVRAVKSITGSIPHSELGKVLWAQLKKELYGD